MVNLHHTIFMWCEAVAMLSKETPFPDNSNVRSSFMAAPQLVRTTRLDALELQELISIARHGGQWADIVE